MPHRPHPQPPDAFEDLLLYRIGLLSSEAGAVVVRLCEGLHGVTRREWRMLALLHGSDNLTPSELARRAHLDRARTSRALSALVEKRLVTRTVKPSNRKKVWLSLTPQGQGLYESLMPEIQNINREILTALDESEVAQLNDFLARLHASAQRLKADMSPNLPKTYRLRGKRN